MSLACGVLAIIEIVIVVVAAAARCMHGCVVPWARVDVP